MQIRFYLQGNTIAGKANVGYALAAWMIVIMARDDGRLSAAATPRRAVAAMRPSPARSGARAHDRPELVLVARARLLRRSRCWRMARFAFQKVPMVLLGWSTLFDKWTLGSLRLGVRRDPLFGSERSR